MWNTTRGGKGGRTSESRQLKGAGWALWKNPPNLTDKQKATLASIQATNKPLYRAYLLKEQFRQVIAVKGEPGRLLLQGWLRWASRSKLAPFVKLARSIRRLNTKAPDGQDELFPTWRHHAVFTDSPYVLVQAESQHRGHAIIEQVFADLIDGPLAHLPSSNIHANAAWLALAAIAHNLTRAAGCLTSFAMAKARGATIRRKIINVAAKVARHARTITLRLPEHWPWQVEWQTLFADTCAPTAPG